jgi:hypothetical protein
MHKLFTSSYDASIYLQQPEQNSGRDELLEIGKTYYGSIKDISRALIKFNVTNISQSISLGSISPNFTASLILKAARSEEIPLEYTIYANAVSQSWTMGTGTKFDNITTDGVSWKYRDGTTPWQSNTVGGTAIFAVGTTGSANAEGGTWYTGSEASQSFSYSSDDVKMDVSQILRMWLSGSIPNEGFILHHSLQNEENITDYGILRFFSKETHTIYEPKLELAWNDFSFSTGSLSAMPDSDYKIVLSNFKNKYPKNSLVKIRLKARELYPLKSFTTTAFEYDQTKYLPTASYYQIQDEVSGDIIFPFNEFTKISCDASGSYFNINLNTLPERRVYRLKLKVITDGADNIIDDKYLFEII